MQPPAFRYYGPLLSHVDHVARYLEQQGWQRTPGPARRHTYYFTRHDGAYPEAITLFDCSILAEGPGAMSVAKLLRTRRVSA